MTVPGHQSVQQVANLAKGYPRLVRRLCEHYGIPTIARGRYRYIANVHIGELIWLVDEWKRRPRMSAPRRAPRRVSIDRLVPEPALV